MGLMARLKGEEPSTLKKIVHVITTGGDTGEFGEWLTEYALANDNLSGRLRTFTNVYVPLQGRGGQGEAEVDILMVHERGVYVMESKNYSGWIFGSAERRQWTQSLKGGRKERFYNPIMQNRTHVKALSVVLSLPVSSFRSFIVFSERCELKKVPDSCKEYVICRRHHLLREVRRDLERREVMFDEGDFARICAAVEGMGKTVEKARAHVERVSGYTSGDTCPWCGKQLVQRHGCYGDFVGCTGYPACRFTRQLGR